MDTELIQFESASVDRRTLRLSKPYSIAGRRIESADNLIVRVTDRSGLTGLGAGTPAPAITGETMPSALKAARIALDFCNRWAEPAKSPFRSPQLDAILRGAPAARAAVEMALLDLDARRQGRPLVDCLGRHHHRLPTSVTIGIQTAESALRDADRHLSAGFGILKVKLGDNVDADISLMRRLRATVGRGVRLRVDANQGYTVAELELFLAATAELGIELVEQPLPRGAWVNHPLISRHGADRPPFVADEDLIDADDADKLARAKPYEVFNIKLMKCGGVTAARDIAARAQAEGISLMWGCMDESCIGIAAALHTAFASANTEFLDLDGSLDLAIDVASGGFRISGGEMETIEAPGLGTRLLGEG